MSAQSALRELLSEGAPGTNSVSSSPRTVSDNRLLDVTWGTGASVAADHLASTRDGRDRACTRFRTQIGLDHPGGARI